MGGNSSKKRREILPKEEIIHENGHLFPKEEFEDLVLSWSLDDILNENLYKNEVETIPVSFRSVVDYLGCYVFPLLEDTRSQLASAMEGINGAPFAEFICLDNAASEGGLLYNFKVDSWSPGQIKSGRGLYRMSSGDILVLSDTNPEALSNIEGSKWTWTLASVVCVEEDDFRDTKYKLKLSSDLQVKFGQQTPQYLVFLTNIMTNIRMWNALRVPNNLTIIHKVLNAITLEEFCSYCSSKSKIDMDGMRNLVLNSKLNESQRASVLNSVRNVICDHKSHVELIWGPPGTGRTMTLSMILFVLSRMNCRTISCGPTNSAVMQVASRVIKLIKESFIAQFGRVDFLCSLGDILFFWENDEIEVGSDFEKVHLDYRVKRLLECLSPLTGWKKCFASAIEFLEDCVSRCQFHCQVSGDEPESFLEFARAHFRAIVPPLKTCMITLCADVPKRLILGQNFQKMHKLVLLLDNLENLLFKDCPTSHERKAVAVDKSSQAANYKSSMPYLISQCLSILKSLQESLQKIPFPSVVNKKSIIEFCFRMASLIFCTTCNSFRLHLIDMEPMNLLVIDGATHLKESESLIPLQLRGLRHALLLGDECQIRSRSNSKISYDAGFGRSLFERLGLLGHPRHLLCVQYRMHPSISQFPNSYFYHKKISDGHNVIKSSYERSYLSGGMFGPYSFINVAEGREESDGDEYSLRNIVEVAVVLKIMQKLHKAWKSSGKSVTIGVLSPYAAQVAVIQEKLPGKYNNLNGFLVKVDLTDGFLGSEVDIMIVSTVRANNIGSLGLLSCSGSANVALTRARHCLWILGNERTLLYSPSVWEFLVLDAKDRGSFYNADEDQDIYKTIMYVKGEIDRLDDFLNCDSGLFRNQKWKVLFSDLFRKSFANIKSSQFKKLVLNLLLKLANGWRPVRNTVDLACGKSMMIVKKIKVQEFYVLTSNDIVKESMYKQVLKVWDILPLEEIPKLHRRLDDIFQMHTNDFISRCNEKCLVGKLEVPKTWPNSLSITRYKNLNDSKLIDDSSDNLDGKCNLENSRVSESLLLVKFYCISVGITNHLLLDGNVGDLDAPFEVTDEELEIIQACRTSFILGRSGTGKTTVLTMKLFQKEQIHHLALEGFPETDRTKGSSVGKQIQFNYPMEEGPVLRQLFVAVNPLLCQAVKQQVSRLRRFSGLLDCPVESSSSEAEDIENKIERDIPDCFMGIPSHKYPLVITLRKFLMMLDGTLGDSYFQMFHNLAGCSGGNIRSQKSVSLETMIRMKEVNYERFCSLYWPHFNARLVKNLDPSRVFSEILSHIKGGSESWKGPKSMLSQEAYVSMSDRKAYTLGSQEREGIYRIFEAYENMKKNRGEFDLADFVINLHVRLEKKKFEGDLMDFIYIDEVQDLSMREISLFKYICKNVNEGYTFSGDTAQTISRGIDFRFQDIRSLFYNEFVSGSKDVKSFAGKGKGLVPQISILSQNFRTHDAVLRLAHSVVDLIYHFFPESIDILKPERSLISGEAPVLLQPGSNENVLDTIFEKRVNDEREVIGFGAEQVILVRDDSSRKEISDHVRNRALVLTITECKGLEFEDVFLYNFFSSSPLGSQWRIIYEFMEKRDLLHSSLPRSIPSFSHEKHGILCHELKLLYVAVTRTKQRLWISESIGDFSNPIFDYWKELCLVQLKVVDSLVIQEMSTMSSPAQWKSKGVKLYWEKNYEMAEMCFKKSGDTAWKMRAKACGLRATADALRYSNPKESCIKLRKAAEIFDSLCSAETAGECFCDLGDYERAGIIYKEKCGDLKRAGECFMLARCFELAAEVYFKSNYIPECLSSCKKGKLFDLGLRYIEYWKQLEGVSTGIEMENIEQDFRVGCAMRCYKNNDIKAMMKHVRAFISMDSKRKFLKSMNFFHELLLLEEESGNFMEAAEIAILLGDIVLAADLLGKAGNFRDASLHILSYVLFNSLWTGGSGGWPMKSFAQKEELLKKALSFAGKESGHFYEHVCAEAAALTHKYINLPDLCRHLSFLVHHRSYRVELLLLRKILEVHFHCEMVKYAWEDIFPDDLGKHSEDTILKNEVSITTLIFFWNLWKENMVDVLRYLEGIVKQDISKNNGYAEFCLNYFGVQKEGNNRNATYVLLKPDVEWAKQIDRRSMCQIRNQYSIDAREFSSHAQSHIRSEIISVSVKVLETIESLYNWSKKASLSMFCQNRCLVDIYQVTSFLSETFNCDYVVSEKLEKLFRLSTKYFENVFSLDCRISLVENMVSLRGSEQSRKLLEEIIIQEISVNDVLNCGQIGRVVMIWLGLGKPTAYLCKKIGERFSTNFSWKLFAESLTESESPQESSGLQVPQSIESFNGVQERGFSDKFICTISSETPMPIALVDKFLIALRQTHISTWRTNDNIPPNCFLYLVERLLILICHSMDIIYTTKCSFVEWLMYLQSDLYPDPISVSNMKLRPKIALDSILLMAKELLSNVEDTAVWIAMSNIDVEHYLPMLVLRLMIVISLLCLNTGEYFDVLSDLLDQVHISSRLPQQFVEAIRCGKNSHEFSEFVNVIAEAFKMSGNPMVIVSLQEIAPEIACSDAISVDIRITRRKEEIMGILFQR